MSDPVQPTSPPVAAAPAPAFATTIQAKGKRWTRRLIIAAVVIMVIGVISRLGGGGDAVAKTSVTVTPVEKEKKAPAPEASQAQMDRLHNIIKSVLSSPHPGELPIKRGDGSTFSNTWLDIHLEKNGIGKVSVLLNSRPNIMIIRYVDEAEFSTGEGQGLMNLDSIKIAGDIIEGESDGKEKSDDTRVKIVDFLRSKWAEPSKGERFNGSIVIGPNKISIGAIKRRGENAEKDGSIGMITLTINIEMPVDPVKK